VINITTRTTLVLWCTHGRRSRGEKGGDIGGTCPPRIWSGGTLIQIVPLPRFCHIGTKMSVLWPSKYAKIAFSAGAPPRTPLGELTTLLRHVSRLERGHPSPYATPLDMDPPSALAMRPPQKSSQIYAYECTVRWQYQDMTAGRGRVFKSAPETRKCRRRNNVFGQSIPDPRCVHNKALYKSTFTLPYLMWIAYFVVLMTKSIHCFTIHPLTCIVLIVFKGDCGRKATTNFGRDWQNVWVNWTSSA